MDGGDEGCCDRWLRDPAGGLQTWAPVCLSQTRFPRNQKPEIESHLICP